MSTSNLKQKYCHLKWCSRQLLNMPISLKIYLFVSWRWVRTSSVHIRHTCVDNAIMWCKNRFFLFRFSISVFKLALLCNQVVISSRIMSSRRRSSKLTDLESSDAKKNSILSKLCTFFTIMYFWFSKYFKRWIYRLKIYTELIWEAGTSNVLQILLQ